MKIFILEDNMERIDFFKERLAKHDLFITDDVTDAMKYIDENYKDIDLYFLDHDLGGDVYVDCEVYNTGSTLAKYMGKMIIQGRIIIHSMNYIGAMNMMVYLPQAEHIPMNLIIRNLK